MLIIAFLLTFLTVAVMVTDLIKFKIPNIMVLAILLIYPVLLFIAPTMPDWQSALLVALASFAGGFVIFALKLMGGGDVKLFAVLTLYIGKSGFLDFLVGVGIYGGILTLFLLAIRPVSSYLVSKNRDTITIPRVLKIGEPVPYGIAIGLSFLHTLWVVGIPGIAIN